MTLLVILSPYVQLQVTKHPAYVCCLLDVESVAESADSKNLPEGSKSQNSVIEDGGAGKQDQNNGMMMPKRPRKKQKALV